jgi:hypothetical protein
LTFYAFTVYVVFRSSSSEKSNRHKIFFILSIKKWELLKNLIICMQHPTAHFMPEDSQKCAFCSFLKPLLWARRSKHLAKQILFYFLCVQNRISIQSGPVAKSRLQRNKQLINHSSSKQILKKVGGPLFKPCVSSLCNHFSRLMSL